MPAHHGAIAKMVESDAAREVWSLRLRLLSGHDVLPFTGSGVRPASTAMRGLRANAPALRSTPARPVTEYQPDLVVRVPTRRAVEKNLAPCVESPTLSSRSSKREG